MFKIFSTKNVVSILIIFFLFFYFICYSKVQQLQQLQLLSQSIHAQTYYTPKHTCNSTITTQGNAYCYFTSVIQKRRNYINHFFQKKKKYLDYKDIRFSQKHCNFSHGYGFKNRDKVFTIAKLNCVRRSK